LSQARQTFLVTSHGKAVAVISPFETGLSPIIIRAQVEDRFAGHPLLLLD